MERDDLPTDKYGVMAITELYNREQHPIAKEQWAAQVEHTLTTARSLKGRIIDNKGWPFYIHKKSFNPYLDMTIKVDEQHVYRRYEVAAERYDDLERSGHVDLAHGAVERSGNLFRG